MTKLFKRLRLPLFALLWGGAFVIVLGVGIEVGYQFPALFGLQSPRVLVDVAATSQNNANLANQSSLAATDKINFTLFANVWKIVQMNSLTTHPVFNELLYGAINGMLQFGFNDPFSSFLPPVVNHVAQTNLDGSFGGIGVELETLNGYLTIASVTPGSPADKAGLLAGDVILQIGEQPTDGKSSVEEISALRGAVGSTVKLKYQHGREQGAVVIDATLTRQQINIPSVYWQGLANKVVYVQVTTMAQDTPDQWDKIVNEIQLTKPKAIILDLRDNAGGYVTDTPHIVSEFVKSGLVLDQKFNDGTEKKFEVSGSGKWFGLPLVVLVNRGTASAAEMVAAALQDYDRGPLVGERTFGKGVIQQIFNVQIAGESNDASVRLVTSKWFTPKGRDLTGLGLQPDFLLDRPSQPLPLAQDPVVLKALELLKAIGR